VKGLFTTGEGDVGILMYRKNVMVLGHYILQEFEEWGGG